MRILLTTLATLVVLVIGAAFALPYALPQTWLRTTLTDALSEASGARVVILGDVGWRVLPRLEARLEDVRVTDTPPDLPLDELALARLDVTVELMELLRGNLVVDRFVLIEPHATVDLTPSAPREAASEGAASPASSATPAPLVDGAPPADLPSVRLGEVRIEQGRLVLLGTGETHVLEALDARLVWPEPAAALSLEMSGRLDGRALALTLEAAAPLALLRAGESRLQIATTLDGAQLGFDGTARSTPPSAEGSLELAVADPARALEAFGGEPVDLPFSTVAGTSRISASAERIDLAALDVDLDATRVQGDLALTLARSRPLLEGSLELGVVDLDEAPPATPPPAAAATGTSETGQPATGGSTPAPPAAAAMPPLPLDLDLGLSLAGLRAPPLVVGPSRLRLRGEGGGLIVDLDEVQAYAGTVRGRLGYAPNGAAALSANLEAGSLDAAALLGALRIDEVSGGRIGFTVDLTSPAASMPELLAIDGTGRIQGSDLTLRQLSEAPQAAALADLLLLGQSGGSVTIADLTASFTASNGIVSNDDLVAGTGALRLTGTGTIDLPGQHVRRYVVTPEPLIDLERLGPLRVLQSIMLPVVIEGPFDDLRIRPDQAALQDRAASELRRALELLGGGGAASGSETGGETGSEENPADAIEQGVRDILRGFGIRP